MEDVLRAQARRGLMDDRRRDQTAFGAKVNRRGARYYYRATRMHATITVQRGASREPMPCLALHDRYVQQSALTRRSRAKHDGRGAAWRLGDTRRVAVRQEVAHVLRVGARVVVVRVAVASLTKRVARVVARSRGGRGRGGGRLHGNLRVQRRLRRGEVLLRPRRGNTALSSELALTQKQQTARHAGRARSAVGRHAARALRNQPRAAESTSRQSQAHLGRRWPR